jgi:hypothetical protein
VRFEFDSGAFDWLSLDVLGEHISWLDSSHDPQHFRPKIDSCSPAPACRAEWLAGESPRDAIHLSTPCSTVEGSNVVPDGGVVKDAVCDSLPDDALAILVSLDVADDPVPEQSMGVDSAACPCE